ncbi:MAG TPA: signal peptidase I [Sulfolobales archaeon]|nr:signal peptidase I [Sulfolobales archaeon]
MSHRGLGSLGVRDVVNISFILIILFMVLGFLLGFYYRGSSLQSLLIDTALLVIRISAAEVARTSIMALSSNRVLKLVMGTIVGLFFGSTIFSSRFANLFTPYGGLFSNISGSIPQVIYNVLVSEIHVLGGLYPALAFRLIVDGYWRLSPYIPNISSFGAISPVILSLIYLFAVILMPGYNSIRGSSEAIFKRSVRKIASIVADISIFVLIILISYSLYANIVPLVVISGSMEPTISMGDIALVVKIRNPSEVRVGDIIAFWNENQIVIHRVVGITENGFITKGDALPSPDPFIVEKNTVIGKAIGSIPKIGWITIIMRSTPEGLRNIASHIYSGIYSYYPLLLGIAIAVTLMVIITRIRYVLNI